MSGATIRLRGGMGHAEMALNGEKTLELAPVADARALEEYAGFTLGSRITGLNGYKEWKNKILGRCPYKVGDIAEAVRVDGDAETPIGAALVVDVDLCEPRRLRAEEALQLGIKRGCGFSVESGTFRPNYYYTDGGRHCAFATAEEASASLIANAYGGAKDALFYKVRFKIKREG